MRENMRKHCCGLHCRQLTHTHSTHSLFFVSSLLSSLRSHLSQTSLPCCFPLQRPAMDPSQQAFHHHLARALMHLNQLASFLPSFEAPTEWDPPSGAPRSSPHHHSFQLSRNLHRFVPLPTDTRPPPSMASHGDLPPHFVMNPESHFHPIIHRDPHPCCTSPQQRDHLRGYPYGGRSSSPARRCPSGPSCQTSFSVHGSTLRHDS